MMRRVSDTMWQSGAITSTLSMLYAHVDPQTGSGSYAAAGDIDAIIAGRYGFRPLHRGGTDPIGVHIDAMYPTVEFQLAPGESLLGYDADMRSLYGQEKLGMYLTDTAVAGSRHPLADIRRAGWVEPNASLGAVTLTRHN